MGDQADPKLECDLVMKGGITSGIVYPGVLQELSETYRFRSIGGTSAGAIAAACAAAAELGRNSDARDAGFAGFSKMSEWLGRDENLKNLFQANPLTRPLMDVLMDILQLGKAPLKNPIRTCFKLTLT